MVNNIDRAEWAAESLQHFADLVSRGQIDEDTVCDLICDIGHYAELELKLPRQEILTIFANGIGAWLAESEFPLVEPTFNKRASIIVED